MLLLLLAWQLTAAPDDPPPLVTPVVRKKPAPKKELPAHADTLRDTEPAGEATLSQPIPAHGLLRIGAREDGSNAVDTELAVSPFERAGSAFVIAPKLGFTLLSASAVNIGGTASVELGWALPVAHRMFALSLEPGIAVMTGKAAQVASGSLVLLSLPLLVSFNRELGPGCVRVLAGPSLDGYFANGIASAAGHFSTAGVQAGALAGAAYLFHLPRGQLGLEALYRYDSFDFAYATQRANGFVIRLAWAFFPGKG